eukprot:3566930-Amphidinium_carterae.3
MFHCMLEQECFDKHGKPYTLKWVDKNKGEKVRSYIVVREIKKAKSEEEKLEPNDVFSAMASRQAWTSSGGYGVRRFTSTLLRDVHVKPSPGLHREGLLAKLNKTMYGTQDASNLWQKLWLRKRSQDHFKEKRCQQTFKVAPTGCGHYSGDPATVHQCDCCKVTGCMLRTEQKKMTVLRVAGTSNLADMGAEEALQNVRSRGPTRRRSKTPP